MKTKKTKVVNYKISFFFILLKSSHWVITKKSVHGLNRLTVKVNFHLIASCTAIPTITEKKWRDHRDHMETTLQQLQCQRLPRSVDF